MLHLVLQEVTTSALDMSTFQWFIVVTIFPKEKSSSDPLKSAIYTFHNRCQFCFKQSFDGINNRPLFSGFQPSTTLEYSLWKHLHIQSSF